jgi:hypothetical protein
LARRAATAAATAAATMLAACGATRVVVTVEGAGFTGITGFDVSFTNETETGTVRVPETGETEVTLPASFGLRLHDGVEGGIVVCVIARGSTPAGGAGCSAETPLRLGGRTDVTVTLAVSVCGDGAVQPPEACDGANLGTETCVTRACSGGTLACTSSCQLDVAGCTGCTATCGDGACNGAETSCDCPADCGPSANNDLCDCGETCGPTTPDCSPCCGDGTCDAMETAANCTADCGATPVCGDGACNGGETCASCSGDCGPTGACYDGNPCTDDGQDGGGCCTYTPNSAGCDDGNACTIGDTCSGGTCSSMPAPDGTSCGAGAVCCFFGSCQGLANPATCGSCSNNCVARGDGMVCCCGSSTCCAPGSAGANC